MEDESMKLIERSFKLNFRNSYTTKDIFQKFEDQILFFNNMETSQKGFLYIYF